MELKGISCVALEPHQEKRKNCCVSRSFGNKLRSYEGIRSALIIYTQKAAAKMRINDLFCSSKPSRVVPQIKEIYPGTSGKTQGDKKLTAPAKKDIK